MSPLTSRLSAKTLTTWTACCGSVIARYEASCSRMKARSSYWPLAERSAMLAASLTAKAGSRRTINGITIFRTG